MRKPTSTIAARRMRSTMTETERILWNAIRRKQLAGYRFLRQHPIRLRHGDDQRFFIVDFYCAKARLAIEADDGIHKELHAQDSCRDAILHQIGLVTLRFTNDEIHEQLPDVLRTIQQTLTERTQSNLHHKDSPYAP